ncbi:12062_t:CDS:2, partial [Rhizophagus irregularis]
FTMVRHRSQRSKEKRIARIKSKRGSARQVVAGLVDVCPEMILWTSLDCSKGDLWTSVLKRICGRLSDYIKELEKKVQELQEQVNGMDRAYRDDQRELLRVHNELKKAERKITRLEGEERDEEGQERRQRRGQGRGKRGK